jgi:hypothetical protein
MHRPLADQRVRAKHGPMTGSCEAIQNASAVTVWIASAFTLSFGGRVVACAPRNDENKKPGLSAGFRSFLISSFRRLRRRQDRWQEPIPYALIIQAVAIGPEAS